MDSLVVVVEDSHGNCLMEPGEILVPVEVTELKLEVAEPALHETVLPGASPFAATERYLHPLAEFLVFVTQVFTALVAMQDCRAWVFTQGIKDGSERQLAAMPGAKPPADNLPSFEVEHDR